MTHEFSSNHNEPCVAAAHADTRTAAKPTADQMRMLKMLEQLAGAADWRGVAAQESAARAVAAAVQTSMLGNASFVDCILGNAYKLQGDFNKAIEYHTLDLAIARKFCSECEDESAPAGQRLPAADGDRAWSARTGSRQMWMCSDIFAAARPWRGCLLTTGRLSCRHPVVV
jgi:hypothetical protein